MRTEEFKEKVDGMICPQCEDEIFHKLIHIKGILNCDVSYRKSEVELSYDPDIISAEDIKAKLASIGYPAGKGRSGAISDIIGACGVIILYFAVPYLTGLVNVPDIEKAQSLSALFIIGLLSGVHCVGMCGGIMLTQKNALAYNSGRLVSYTAMGAIFGAIGKVFTYDAEVKSMLFTICGVLVVLIGLMMWGVPMLRRFNTSLIKPCRFKGRTPIIIGLLTGLMPCGMLSAMWLAAASSGSAVKGAESMFAFGAGTCVMMLIFGMFGVLIPAKYNKYLLKASTVFIVALGLLMMAQGAGR